MSVRFTHNPLSQRLIALIQVIDGPGFRDDHRRVTHWRIQSFPCRARTMARAQTGVFVANRIMVIRNPYHAIALWRLTSTA